MGSYPSKPIEKTGSDHVHACCFGVERERAKTRGWLRLLDAGPAPGSKRAFLKGIRRVIEQPHLSSHMCIYMFAYTTHSHTKENSRKQERKMFYRPKYSCLVKNSAHTISKLAADSMYIV